MRKLLMSLIILLASSIPAAAYEVNDGLYVGLFAGYTQAQDAELPSSLDSVRLEDAVFGVQVGWIENRLGVSGSLSTFGDRVEAKDVDLLFFDVSVHFNAVRGEHFTFDVFGGPGWSFVDGGDGFGVDDSVTVHAGLGIRAGSESFFVRPDVRARWSDDKVGYEARLGIGWQF